MSKRFRIGIDIDDTLLNSVDVVTRLNNELYGTKLGRDDWFSVTTGALRNWGFSSGAEVSGRVNELIIHKDYLKRVSAIEGAKDILDRIVGEGCELFAITSRPDYMRRQTVEALGRCFPGLFSNEALFMINAFSADPTTARITKLGVAQELQLTHFIDDIPVHVNAVAGGGIASVLFSDNYHWNQLGVNDSVTRLDSWKAIGDYFDAEAA